MNRINCYSFYSLGKWISKLGALNEKTKLIDIAIVAMQAERFLLSLVHSDVKLKATSEASSSLFTGCRTLTDLFGREDEKRNVPSSLQLNMTFSGIAKSIEKLENVLSAELVMAPIYSVASRGVFSTDSLLDSADDVFDDAKEKIPDDARADTRQAGRCLAFDLPTAAGFHIARATESVMTKAMDAFGCPKLKESQRNWGVYIKALEEHGASKTVVHHLCQLKDLHRNPLIHPEVTLTQLEAQQLWSMCTSAMIALIADIEAHSQKPLAATGV